jgi:Cu-processing system permease protein
MKPFAAVKRIATIAATELRLARRNLWVALATALLALFALALAFLGAGAGAGLKADVMSLTAASLASLSVYLIPLLALVMSYDTLAGEIDRGTLALTLATPVRRGEVLAGKFLAQSVAVGGAVAIGFGLAGAALVLVYGASPEGLAAWGRLVGSSVALGSVFVALGICLSAFSGRGATAAALAIGLWLIFVVLYDLALLGAVIAAGKSTFTSDIFPWLVLANPADAFRLFNLAALDAAPVSGIDGLARTLPFPPIATLAALAAWLACALAAGRARMKRIVP